jgi:hypothetical protein
MNIFNAWKVAEARFEQGYGIAADLADRADLTVVLGLLGEAIEQHLAEEDGRIASLFDDAADRLTEATAGPDLDAPELVERLQSSIHALHHALRELREGA